MKRTPEKRIVDKQSYVEAFRARYAQYEKAVRRRHDWLFFWSDRRGVLRSDAKLTEAFVSDVRSLEPPPEDADEIERRLIAPIEGIVQLMRSLAASPHHRQASPDEEGHTDFRRRLDLMDFCRDYGLIDGPAWKVHATFEERIGEAGLDTLPPTDVPRKLDDDQRRRMVRQFRGGRIERTLDAHPDPTWGVFYAARVTGGWACCVVAMRSPEVPVEAFLAKPPPRKWRKSPVLVAVHGDPEPGGLFVVEFTNSTLRATKSPARFAAWPPTPPHRFAEIVLV